MANLSNINDKFIVTDGGNVLIGGNISGSSILQVTGTSTFTSGSTVLSLNRTGGATALIELKIGGTVEGYLGANTTKSLIVFNESAAEKFSVSNGGNGIFTGTLNSGSITSTGQIFCSTDTTTPTNGQAVFYKASAGAVVSGYQVILESGSAASRETALTISETGKVGIGLAPASSRRLLVKGLGTTSSTASFQVNDGNNADVFLIKDDKSATFTGNVTATTYLINRTSVAGIGTSLGDINGAELGPGYLTVSRDDTANAKQLSFYKNNVEHSYFETTTSGLNIGGTNVGIGTTSPSEKLQVKGNICVNSESVSTATAEIDKIEFKKSHPNGVSGYYILGEIRSKTFGGYSGGLNFYTGRATTPGSYASTFAMAIDNFGRVGIGINQPTQPLDVNGIMKHKGLDMTSGSQVDQTTTFNVSLVASANTWTDIPGIIGSDIPSSGHYMVGLYSDARGSSGWYYVYWTTYMGWNLTSGSNSSEFSEMPLTYGAHSTNGNSLELRTSMQNGTGGTSNQMRIQFKVSFATTGTALRLIFRRLI